MKIAKHFIGVLILGLFLVSCQKTESLNWDDIYSTGGTISVNIVGTSNDGIPLNESLIADKYSTAAPDASASYRIYSNTHSFYFKRNMDKFGNSFIGFRIDYYQGIISNTQLDLRYVKTLENNEILEFDFWVGSYCPPQITDFTFDENTGNLTGKYFCQCPGYNNDTITVSGDFNLNVTQVYY